MHALHASLSPDELWHQLVFGQPAMVERDTFIVAGLLKRVHSDGAEGVAETVVLMATDPRWKSVGNELMHAIVDLGIVAAGQLDEIAEAFVAAEDHLFWECPDEWFSSEFVVLVESGESDDTDNESDEVPDHSDGPAMVRRTIPGGARRWATSRVVWIEPTSWDSLLALGLRRLAERDCDAARARALDDVNKRVRDRAGRVGLPRNTLPTDETEVANPDRLQSGDQSRLF
jgi:hypothetical protein